MYRHHTDHPQKGNNDLLILTQPEALEEIHYNYAVAGADIVETNRLSSTTIAPVDYGLEAAVHDLNHEGARIVTGRWNRRLQKMENAGSSPVLSGPQTGQHRFGFLDL